MWEQMVTWTSVTLPLVTWWIMWLCGAFTSVGILVAGLCISLTVVYAFFDAAFVAGLSELPLAMFPLTSVTRAGVGRCRLGPALTSPCTSCSESGCWGVCTLWCVGLEVRFASLSILVHPCTCAACQVLRLKVPPLKVQVSQGPT